MIKKKLLVAWMILFFSVPGFAWTGAVYEITDGDTIKVINQGKIEKIRLYGIDTPEKSQKGGKKAAAFVWDILKPGQKVSIESIDVDRYKRTIGLVQIQATGLNLNEALVKNGHAWVYTRYCKKSFCPAWAELEAAAREKRLGLWADSDPVPPWTYRKQKRN